MPKINKKKSFSKFKCPYFGTCWQYEKYLELKERYGDWCFDPITKGDIELIKLFASFRAPFPAKKIELLELEKEMYEVILIFHLVDFYEESKGVSSMSYRTKTKLKRHLKKRIERIVLRESKIILLLT